MNKKKQRRIGFISVLFFLVCGFSFPRFWSQETLPQKFRNEVLTYVRQAAGSAGANQIPEASSRLQLEGSWSIQVKLYLRGVLKGESSQQGGRLDQVLQTAAAQVFQQSGMTREELSEARFLIRFTGKNGSSPGILEYRGKALESTDDVSVVREINPKLFRAKIQDQKNYLLRAMDPEYHGFYKKYDAGKNVHEVRLRTIYTASSLFTLLKISDRDKDPRIAQAIEPIADYLLSMQAQDGVCAGGFHYSFDPKSGAKEERFVVGTASKTIFTLLDLYRRTKNERYLESAVKAGKWLSGQVQADGKVDPVMKLKAGNWERSTQDSILYTGQVLSALSRLYAVTSDKLFYQKAESIANRLLKKVEEAGYFIGDEYRRPNTISTSWAAMSLLDFSKINSNPVYLDTVFKCYEQILKKQITDPEDILNAGRFGDTKASSGNGWINEVMVEVYKACRAGGRDFCEDYHASLRQTSRWLVQNIYSWENTFQLPAPERAIGGSIRDSLEESVRTDAVCHGANGLIGVEELFGKGVEFSIPEQDWESYLNGLRAS